MGNQRNPPNWWDDKNKIPLFKEKSEDEKKISFYKELVKIICNHEKGKGGTEDWFRSFLIGNRL